ncbi:methyltransferase domain-containing protein [Candidatus Saccharibacteria bacterium]|nr:methyltransferase domain-containing protein [Candidatus Saccharibacteria bacterium]
MITQVLDLLRCPVCGQRFASAITANPQATSIACVSQHHFDIAKQGFVTLLRSQRNSEQIGDTADMVERRIAWLEAGYYDAIAAAVSKPILNLLRTDTSGLTVGDLGAGPGYYAGFLAREAKSNGVPIRIIALDNSLYAARRAAKVDPNVASVRGDTWDELPFADAALDVVIVIFAPMNLTEIARVLKPGGTLIVVTPEADHLATLRAAVPMLNIPEAKSERLAEAALGHFSLDNKQTITTQTEISPNSAANVILMGPSALHLTEVTLLEVLSQRPTCTLDIAVTINEFKKL